MPASVSARAPVAAITSAARADIFELLASAWAFPTEAQYQLVKSGQWQNDISHAAGRLSYRLRTADLDWSMPGGYEAMESEYIRLFQIGGRRGPPCSLHSGFYGRDRSRTLQHLIRFYNFFGFSLNECVMPDQICVELEFMYRLAGGDASDADSLLRAQRDFLRGHLAWTATLAQRVRPHGPLPFYRSLTALTDRVVQADRLFIESAVLAGGTNVRL